MDPSGQRDLGDKFPPRRSSRARQPGAAEPPISLSPPLFSPTAKVLKEEKLSPGGKHLAKSHSYLVESFVECLPDLIVTVSL